MKIVFTGGSGRFGSVFKKKTKLKNIIYPKRREFNILDMNSINKYISKHKPKIIIHAAALSRPMEIHDKKIDLSIDTNIIGTCNIVKICKKKKIKLIYLSTNYVYPGFKGNYNENSSLLPYNNYAWSKLGGECAVNMYKNSLILRVAMSEKPWKYNQVYKNVYSNYLYHDEVVKILPKLLNKKGIINIGSKYKSIVKFAKRTNKHVKITKFKQPKNLPIVPIDSSMNIKKLKKILKNKIL